MPGSPSLLRTYANAQRDGRVQTEIDLIFTLPPTVSGVKVTLPFGPSGLVIFNQTDNQKRKVVQEFARFLCRPEVIRDFCKAANQLPSRKSVGPLFEDKPALARLQKLAVACGRADMGLTARHYYDIRKRLPPQLQFAFLGRKTPAEALHDFSREAQTVLQR